MTGAREERNLREGVEKSGGVWYNTLKCRYFGVPAPVWLWRNSMDRKEKWTPVVLGMGLAGMLLRFSIYALGKDEKGLLIAGHPLQLGLWALTLAALVAAVLICRKEDTARDRTREGLGELFGALGIGLSVLTGFSRAVTVLDGALLVVSLAAAGCLVLAGVLRLRGKESPMVCYGVVCVYFALYLVCGYRGWSARPQLQDWFYSAMGGMAAMIFAYLRCVAGKRRLRQLVGLLGCFLCLTAIPEAGDPTLFLGAAFWLLTSCRVPGEETVAPENEERS